MARTTPDLVRGVLSGGGDYDADLAPDLTPYITAANIAVNRCQSMAANKIPPRTLAEGGPNGEAEVIERWLAAHLYCVSDATYLSRSTDGASGQFETGQVEKGFQSTKYGRMAVSLDYSGCLENLGKKQRASAFWLGKYPSAQVPYDQKD